MNRAANVLALQSAQYDLLVIGGGITGAGIALDAAARGLKTALVEKDDFASGTSSRSTKLIHGGLRYLKQLEFALVKEVGSERAIVHRLAPHLVVPEKMLLPLYEKRGLGYWLTSIGLKIYDWLAGVKPEDQRKMLTRLQTLNHEPLLKKDDVKGGAIYAEYRTDDARLTIEIMKLAARKGACVANYIEVTGFLYSRDAISGALVVDGITGNRFSIDAKIVVNATGPWVDELRILNQSRQGKQLHLTKGVHIVVPFHRLPVHQAIYFDVPDGRMIFAIPRGRITYIGTTDTDYEGNKDRVLALRNDVDYILNAVNETFPSVLLTLADVESSWAGLRPLIHEEGKSASELSRKDEIFESPTGLISIAGGKLTGYRKMAERVVDKVIEQQFESRDLEPCNTDQMILPGGDFKSYDEVKKLEAELAARLGALNLRGNEATNLVHLYGTQALIIAAHFEQHQTGEPELDLLLAQAWFGIHHEMAITPLDLINRRSGFLYFNRPKMIRHAVAVVDYFGSMNKWDKETIDRYQEQVQHALTEVTRFDPDFSTIKK
ncbi:MAG: glycerol-3-phosphate dehydrogenase/oxidase [Cyclobacteriaceae bacterium]|nr:glycerol-3-phosphate dehydrogenase/oxidase [Cyclobacteriaceae bacterium]